MNTRVLISLSLLFAAGPSSGQLIESRDADNGRVYRMTIHPAVEPVPRLHYRLLTADADLRPGNAATFWYRALLNLQQNVRNAGKVLEERLDAKADEDSVARQESGYDTLQSWAQPRRVQISKIPLELAQSILDLSLWNRVDVQAASCRERCDWDLGVRGLSGAHADDFSLPEFQEMRWLSLLLCLDARIAVAEGRVDRALDSLRINNELALDAARPPLLVCRLIANVLGEQGRGVLRELQCHPGAPSLYWALADLPRPFIDLREAVRFESEMVGRRYRLIEDAESSDRSAYEWRRLYNECLDDLLERIESDARANPQHLPPGGGDALVDWIEGLRDPGPEHPGVRLARGRLLEGGFDAATLDAMPTERLLAIDASRVVAVTNDRVEGAFYLPWPEGQAAMRDADAYRRAANPLGNSPHREVLPIAKLSAFSYPVIRESQIAAERDFASLRLIEALRLHAGENGSLPGSLDEVTCVTLPLNPITGAPFDYRLDGETAVISCSAPNMEPWRCERYELRLAE